MNVHEQASRESGFTLVEVAAALTIAALMLMSLQSTLMSSIDSRQRTEEIVSRQIQAYGYVQRLLAIPFGSGAESNATAAQLTELFDDDEDLGNVTLRAAVSAVGTGGHAFTSIDAGVATEWRVRISNDFDGDGLTTGFREGRLDLYQIEVFANERLMFRTMRAADYANTTRD